MTGDARELGGAAGINRHGGDHFGNSRVKNRQECFDLDVYEARDTSLF